jgi:hypothetical protein
MRKQPDRFLRRFVKKLKSLLKRPPENPDDPYALVGARVLPRPPQLSAKAAAVPERDWEY